MEQVADTIRIRTVRDRTTFWSRLAGLVAVIVPPVGLVAGTVLLWNHGVNWVDLVDPRRLLRPVRARDHGRLAPVLLAQELRDGPRREGDARDPRLDGDAGAADAVGDRPPQAPRALRPARRPALAARRPRPRHVGAGARALALARRLALLDEGPRARAGVRQGPLRRHDGPLDRPAVPALGRRSRSGCRSRSATRSSARGRAALETLVWAGLVRIFLFQHVTFSINSICHMFGKRPFRTRDESRNVWLLALPSFGESWHNGHHAFPASAVHGLERGPGRPLRRDDPRARAARSRVGREAARAGAGRAPPGVSHCCCGGAPLVGSYAPSPLSDGTVQVERITKSGSTTVYRKTMGVRAASKTYVLRSGDQFALPVGSGRAVEDVPGGQLLRLLHQRTPGVDHPVRQPRQVGARRKRYRQPR